MLYHDAPYRADSTAIYHTSLHTIHHTQHYFTNHTTHCTISHRTTSPLITLPHTSHIAAHHLSSHYPTHLSNPPPPPTHRWRQRTRSISFTKQTKPSQHSPTQTSPPSTWTLPKRGTYVRYYLNEYVPILISTVIPSVE